MDPETGLFIGIISGLGGVVTYVAYNIANKLGPQLELKDLLPMPPPYPPLPRFLYTKPDVLTKIRG